MKFVYTPQDGFYAARKNGVKIVSDIEPDEQCEAFAELLADGYAAAFPRICEFIFSNADFSTRKEENDPNIPENLKLDFIRIFSDGSTELWYRFFLPFEGRRVEFCVDVGFTGVFEEFTDIFID